MTRSGGPVRADVGIVVVSHSRALAQAAVALAAQMQAGRPVRVAVAAGLDETTLGTDATRIRDAIAEVDGPDGVVVLMDLGSAVLSAELALDLLADPAVRDRIQLSPAPIVEGLVAAFVAAAGGGDLAEVAAEAAAALAAKSAHLSGPAPEPETGAPGITAGGTEDADGGDAVVARVRVVNEHGLHARPAARLVSEAGATGTAVTVRNVTTGAGPVRATSLSRVASLAVLRGHEIELRATGPLAREAVERLAALAARRFDEPVRGDAPPAPATRTRTTPTRTGSPGAAGPLPASPGVAVGPLRRIVAAPVPQDVQRNEVHEEPGAAWRRVAEAVAEVRELVQARRARAAREIGEEEARIFDAHLSLLADPEVLDAVRARIEASEGAVGAWSGVLAEVEQRWAGLPDPYLRARAADVAAVGGQVLRALTGRAGSGPSGPSGAGILVAAALTPADVAELDPAVVSGLVLAEGSPSSHAAILARAQGIPAVVAAGPDVLGLAEGTTLALDGGTGELFADPAEEVLSALTRRAGEQARERARDRVSARLPAATVDGATVAVLANVGSAAQARAAAEAGADGAGLVRTEFLFQAARSAPGAEEQEAAYRAVVAALPGRSVTFRTLDVGGDKPLPFLPVPAERNPFLGVRGIRLTLARPDVMRTQLAALCRVARDVPVGVLLPMVCDRAELTRALALLAEAAGPGGLPPGLRVGMMVEVPAAALKIERFLPDLDFVSIGTNDLVQYTLAAERGNPGVASLADALDPALLRLVDRVCRAAAGRAAVSVCGDAAADPDAVPLLLGLGIDALSVPGPQVPGVKARVRTLDRRRCTEVAAAALDAAGAGEVRELVRTAFPLPVDLAPGAPGGWPGG